MKNIKTLMKAVVLTNLIQHVSNVGRDFTEAEHKALAEFTDELKAVGDEIHRVAIDEVYHKMIEAIDKIEEKV